MTVAFFFLSCLIIASFECFLPACCDIGDDTGTVRVHYRLLVHGIVFDDDAQHDNSNHSIVYARQTVEGRRCKEKEAGRRKWKEKEARMCKGKATPSTALSCPPVARTRSMKGKLVMEDDKFDHPKAFSVPYPEAKKLLQNLLMFTKGTLLPLYDLQERILNMFSCNGWKSLLDLISQ
uniref:Uncharacterized protein LOC105045941 isoform X3 n=1 Tax=Elaeis guineensis var. tenera TaxID=51953 RepID=A0A8N4F7B5_ELAGV|nr:uncharacterized protein LOC105045941 isoform X3 [Elaeis guineensis]